MGKIAEEMLKPVNPLSDDEINTIFKVRDILNGGMSAEIKRKTDGSMVVYAVEKHKR